MLPHEQVVFHVPVTTGQQYEWVDFISMCVLMLLSIEKRLYKRSQKGETQSEPE